jgi:hypothetical protein
MKTASSHRSLVFLHTSGAISIWDEENL